MEDLERYSDYNEYEDDIPKGKSKVGLILKIIIAVVCLSVVGILVFRIIIFNYYPDGIENIYFNDKLTAYYNETGGNIGAKTQNLKAEYDDEDEGNFFCDNLIFISELGQLQISVRYNTSLMESIKEKYGVSLNANDKDIFEFSLVISPFLNNEGGNVFVKTGSLSNKKFDKMMMYRYYKLVFDDVDFDYEEQFWISLEIRIKGVEMKEPYRVLVFQKQNEDAPAIKDYVLSSKEKPGK